MSNNGNYGYFGTGSSGYAHYMQAFNETTSSGGYSTSAKSTKSSSSDDDSFWLAIVILFSPVILPLFIVRMFVKMMLE